MAGGAVASFLARLSPADRARLEEAGERRRHRAGDVLFHEGGVSDAVLVVSDGHVKVVKLGLDGRTALIELRGPGDLLGEQGVIDRVVRSASIVALTDLTVLRVPADRFRELLRTEAPITNAVLETVVARLRRASLRQLELSTSDGVSRVCARLGELGEQLRAAGGGRSRRLSGDRDRRPNVAARAGRLGGPVARRRGACPGGAPPRGSGHDQPTAVRAGGRDRDPATGRADGCVLCCRRAARPSLACP